MPADFFETKHIQIKLDENEYNALDDKARSARMKITPFARELFLAALNRKDGDKQEGSVTSRRWCKLLDFILTHGTKEQREWIIGNLKTFSAAVEARVASKNN